MKWTKALNGYYFSEPDKKHFYQIEVYKKSDGKIYYSAKLYLKQHDDFAYLRNWPSNSLKEEKQRAQKHYEQQIQNNNHLAITTTGTEN